MKRIFSFLKLTVLISVLPLLIGHGLGTVGHESAGQVPLPPDENKYIISGGTDQTTPIYTSAPMRITVNSQEVAQTSADSTSLRPIVFVRQYYVPDMKIDVHSSSGSDSRVGALWLHIVDKQGGSTKFKLLHGSLTGPMPFRFFQANFYIADLKEVSDQGPVVGALRGDYVLSGGRDIAAPITTTGDLTISLDSTQLVSQRSAVTSSHAPLSFSATAGSILTVDLKSYGAGYDGTNLETPLWLHLPSGEAIKLAHQAIPTTTSYFNAHFVIP